MAVDQMREPIEHIQSGDNLAVATREVVAERLITSRANKPFISALLIPAVVLLADHTRIAVATDHTPCAMAVNQMRKPIEDVQSGDSLPEPAGLASPAVRGNPRVHNRLECACEAAFNVGRLAVKVA